MTTYTEFYGHGYEQSSGPLTIVDVHEGDIWPIADNSIIAKDAIGIGLHPVVAVGSRAVGIPADGRPMNVTGVVISFSAGLTTRTGRVRLNVADGYIVRNYVANVLTYTGGDGPLTFETAPIIGQPVYVDDSDDLGAGCTLSLSPLNAATTQLRNPMAGVIWYCQDEYIDAAQGGPNIDDGEGYIWTPTWDNEYGEYDLCILLANGWREPDTVIT